MFSFLIYLKNYFYNPWGQVGFKDPATSLMENIIDLHHFIFFFILIISGLVLWLLIQIIDNFIYLYNIRPQVINKKSKKYNTLDNFILFAFVLLASKTLKFKENKYLEACWTLFPAVILIIISLPSFYMLYLAEENIETLLTVKAIGFQWYWTYDYTDLFPFWYNLKTDNLDIDDFVILSYIEPTEYLDFDKGQFRLLETDDILVLPTNLHLRLIITSMDTLHSFGLPSLGLKIDAVPGRLNKIDIFIYRMGVFYGQCSEICGVGHGFMPICLYAVSYLNFLIGELGEMTYISN
jgi:cytochrome c oxidase subunit 2